MDYEVTTMKSRFLFIGLLLTWMFLSIGYLEAISGKNLPPMLSYADFFKVKDPGSRNLITRTMQTWSGAWNDDEKCSAIYNQQGLCTEIVTREWYNNNWRDAYRRLYTYDAGNRLVHIDFQEMADSQWAIYTVEEWNYEGERLIQIENFGTNPQGQLETALLVDFCYAADSGILQQKIETFVDIAPGYTPMNRFDYTWDAQGRLSAVQKYQKNLTDESWQIDLRDSFSYLPQDQSTYQEHLESILFGYASKWIMDGPSFLDWLIDRNPIEYTSDEGLNFNPYYLYEYIYTPELVLSERRYYCTFMGAHDLEFMTSYAIENDTLLIVTNYEQDNGELLPDYRYLYSYSSSTANDDPATPEVPGSMSVYPNPCRQDGTISFELAKAAPTQIEVYNLKGQKVRTLLNSHCSSGKHDLQWDARDERGKRLSSGIYLLKLTTGREQRFVKIAVM